MQLLPIIETAVLPTPETDFPLTFTELAKEKLATALVGEPEGTFVRVGLVGGGCSGWKQVLSFDQEFDSEEDLQITIDFNPQQFSILAHEPYSLPEESIKSFRVVTDYVSALYLRGTEIDFVTERFSEGFKFREGTGTDSPKIKSTCGCGSSVSY